jgi:flavin-binding protein dodecin
MAKDKKPASQDRVYAVAEIVGTSRDSMDAAIRNAVETASQTLRSLEWFEVVESRGHIVDGKVAHFQVALKIGFRYEPK